MLSGSMLSGSMLGGSMVSGSMVSGSMLSGSLLSNSVSLVGPPVEQLDRPRITCRKRPARAGEAGSTELRARIASATEISGERGPSGSRWGGGLAVVDGSAPGEAGYAKRGMRSGSAVAADGSGTLTGGPSGGSARDWPGK
jgi:hypothetical protein